jgi:uncharacterized protein YxjI
MLMEKLMARKNIFELLSNEYDIKEERNKIVNLFNSKIFSHTNPLNLNQQQGLSIEYIVDNWLLVNWKQRNGCLSCLEIRKKIKFNNLFSNFSLESTITIIEYISNLIYLIQKKILSNNNINFQYNTIVFNVLCQNIDLLLEHINYEKHIFDNDEKVIIVPKNPAATAVAEISSQETVMAILKYHHASLKGQIEGKKKILLSIAHEYEALLSKGIKGFDDYFTKARDMLNNLDIRHNNKTGKNKKEFVINMKPEELEKWYDDLYQLLLFCVLIKDNKHRKDEISKFLEQTRKTK